MTPHQPTSSRHGGSLTTPAWDDSSLASDPHASPDKPERVQRMFAAIARSYDLNNRLHSFGRDQVWRRKAVRLSELQPSDAVLDAACGTGDLAEAYADHGAAKVVGLDFTQRMLDIAEAKARNRKRRNGANAPTYVQGDAMRLPFEDASFDIVSIAFGIRNVADPAKVLREFRRVLRPKGRLVNLEFSEPNNPLLRAANRLYTRRIMPWTATLIARDRSGAYRYLPKSIEMFLDREAMCAAMRDAGFMNVSMHPMTFGVCVAYRGYVPA